MNLRPISLGRIGYLTACGVAITLMGSLIQGVPSEASPVPQKLSTTSSTVTSPADPFGSGTRSSSDAAVDGFGDDAGYHVEVARESDGFAWHTAAILKPQGVNVSSWTGYQCLSGDGKYAAVVVLGSSSVNLSAARDRGAFAYSVELATGKVMPVASGVAYKYFSPACATSDTAVFTTSLGADEQTTGIVSADLSTGKVTGATTVAGQVTSLVPTKDGTIAVLGSQLVSVPDGGTAAKPAKPKALAKVDGSPFDLRPAASGGVDFLVAKPDGVHGELMHFDGKGAAPVGSGKLAGLSLSGRGTGPNTVVGLDSAPGGGAFKTVDASKLPGTIDTVSVDGDAVFTAKPAPQKAVKAGQKADDAQASTDTLRQVFAMPTGKAADRAFDTAKTAVTTTIASYIPDGVAGDHSAERNTIAPKSNGDKPAKSQSSAAPSTAPSDHAPSSTPKPSSPGSAAPSPKAAAPSTAPAPSAKATGPKINTSVYTGSVELANSTDTPTCAIPRLDPTMQVMQPSNAQVDWATQMAEQGLLSGPAYARPANFDNMGLVSYSPSDDFPPVPLDHPSSSSQTTVPRSVMLGILAQESNFNQASWHALPGVSADPLIADYYGSAGAIDQIDYPNADCGYGIAQVTDGMHVGDTSLSHHGQMKVANDYQENISAGLDAHCRSL